jgi:hypothetical protein
MQSHTAWHEIRKPEHLLATRVVSIWLSNSLLNSPLTGIESRQELHRANLFEIDEFRASGWRFH